MANIKGVPVRDVARERAAKLPPVDRKQVAEKTVIGTGKVPQRPGLLQRILSPGSESPQALDRKRQAEALKKEVGG